MPKPLFEEDEEVRFSNDYGYARNEQYDGQVARVTRVHKGSKKRETRYDIVFSNGDEIEAMEDDLKSLSDTS